MVCPTPRYLHFEGSAVNRTQKPINLIRHLINHFSVEGFWILDCVLAVVSSFSLCSLLMALTLVSGTTAQAAVLNMRHFVSVELDPHQYKAIIHRVEANLEFNDNSFPDDKPEAEEEEEADNNEE